MKIVENLITNSELPGPGTNLEFLNSFSKNATEYDVEECLSYYKDERAIVATLCKPKLLKEKLVIIEIFKLLTKIKMDFAMSNGNLP